MYNFMKQLFIKCFVTLNKILKKEYMFPRISWSQCDLPYGLFPQVMFGSRKASRKEKNF